MTGPESLFELFDLGSPAETVWMLRAVCAETDPEAFFPEKGASTRPAKRVCAGCPVTSECLAYALAADLRHGVWGGLSAVERQRLRVTARAMSVQAVA